MRLLASADPLETLKGDDLQKWNTCVGMVEKLGIESDQAQDIVSRAFGWGSQAYWRKEKVNEVPEPVEVRCHPAFENLVCNFDTGIKGLAVIPRFSHRYKGISRRFQQASWFRQESQVSPGTERLLSSCVRTDARMGIILWH